MRIQILGTGAAEAWPALFCGCKTCVRARQAGGKDYRSRASLQIDDLYKIDLPPDTYYHMVRFHLDLSALKYLFITHSHEDHLAGHELAYVRPPFAHNLAHPPIRVYGNAAVASMLEPVAGRCQGLLEVHQAEPFLPIKADHLAFTPVIAEHAPPEQALNYVIQSPSATVLYACDTGLYGEQTMGFLAGLHLDLAIIECTQGTQPLPSTYHMGWEGVLRLRDDLAKLAALPAQAPVVITHFSHNIGLLHEELEALAAPEGVTVAYDGITLEL